MISREIADHIVRVAVNSDEEWQAVIFKAGGLDIAACEAAGLAHDIGHPPFGHAGEDAIDQYLRKGPAGDGFEGNAQTFRTVTRLDRLKGKAPYGLDLTSVTLAAILKYPHLRREPHGDPDNRKFGAYASDEDVFKEARANVFGNGDDGSQSLEASVMDLADDVAYAIHDLEDFVAAGLIDVGVVRSAILSALDDGGVPWNDEELPDFEQANFEVSSSSTFVAAASRLRGKYAPHFNDFDYAAALHDVARFLGQLADPDGENYLVNLRMQLSVFVEKFFTSIVVSESAPYVDGPRVYLSSESWHQMQVLKSITRQFLVSRPKMGTMQRGQTEAIRHLLEGLASWLSDAPAKHSLPPALVYTLKIANAAIPVEPIPVESLSADHFRAISDYICTMSDSEALMRSQWLSGTEVPGSFRLALA